MYRLVRSLLSFVQYSARLWQSLQVPACLLDTRKNESPLAHSPWRAMYIEYKGGPSLVVVDIIASGAWRRSLGPEVLCRFQATHTACQGCEY